MAIDPIARHLLRLQKSETITVVPLAVRNAQAHAKRITDAVQVLDFEGLQTLLDNAPLNAATVALLVHVATRNGASIHQRKAAQAKNAKARAYVLAEWALLPQTPQNKAAFARRYMGIVRRKFKTQITAETISRDWLPKGDIEDRPKGAIAWTGRYQRARKP